MNDLFEIKGKVAVITGGAGILCSEMAKALAEAGVKVAILDLNLEKAEAIAAEINRAGGKAIAIKANVLDKPSLIAAKEQVLAEYQRVDILINGAGGNKKEATKPLFVDRPKDRPIDAPWGSGGQSYAYAAFRDAR